MQLSTYQSDLVDNQDNAVSQPTMATTSGSLVLAACMRCKDRRTAAKSYEKTAAAYGFLLFRHLTNDMLSRTQNHPYPTRPVPEPGRKFTFTREERGAYPSAAELVQCPTLLYTKSNLDPGIRASPA